MSLLMLTALFVFWIASPGSTALSPHSLYEAGLLNKRPPPCRVEAWQEKADWEKELPAKAATWSIDGAYRCEQEIFAYGDRDAYANFILTHAAQAARSLALTLSRMDALGQGQSRIPGLAPISQQERVIWIEVQAADRALGSRVEQIFRQDLRQSLTQGWQVMRGSRPIPDLEGTDKNMVLPIIITLVPTHDPQYAFRITFASGEKKFLSAEEVAKLEND